MSQFKGHRAFVILMYLAIVMCIVFIFESYHLSEMSKHGVNGVTNPLIGRYFSLLRFIFVAFVSLMCLFIKFKKTLLYVYLLMFNFYLLLQFFFNSEFLWFSAALNSYTSSCLWIYVYFYSYICTYKYRCFFSVERITCFLSVLFFVLFLRNYIVNASRGIQWSYIESYFMITILPVLPWLNVKLRYLVGGMASLTMLLAAKRTGILMGGVVFMCYMTSRINSLLNFFKAFLFAILIGGIGSCIISICFDKQFNHLFQRFQNISEDGGSGRDIVFAKVFYSIFDSSTGDFVFGHGYNAVLLDKVGFGFSAHNEFLEVFYDYGLVGIMMFSMLFVLLLRIWRQFNGHPVGSTALMSCLALLMLSMTSHSILTTTSILPLALMWGYIDAYKHALKR